MDDPDAPIGHHWQDSTHVTFGVATAGLVGPALAGCKIEGSIFTGREPDEDRYDFDQPAFRFLQRPDFLEPDAEIWRCRFRTVTSRARKHSSRTLKQASHDRVGHLQSAARTRSQLVEHVRLGTKPRHGRGQNAIVPGRNKLSARARYRLSALGARGKIRDTNWFSSHRRIRNFSRERLHDRIRPRFVTRQRHRYRPRHPIHNQRPSR